MNDHKFDKLSNKNLLALLPRRLEIQYRSHRTKINTLPGLCLFWASLWVTHFLCFFSVLVTSHIISLTASFFCPQNQQGCTYWPSCYNHWFLWLLLLLPLSSTFKDPSDDSVSAWVNPDAAHVLKPLSRNLISICSITSSLLRHLSHCGQLGCEHPSLEDYHFYLLQRASEKNQWATNISNFR